MLKNKNKQFRNIALFVSSQTLSLFGSSLVQYAITWYITLQTKSGIMMTISAIAGFLPMFLLSPFAGVWADRYDRKKLIMISDGFIAASTLVLAIVFLAGYRSLWLLFVVSAIRSVGSAIQSPAVNAFLPQITPENQLTRVNAINGTIQSVIMFLAPMLSGLLLNVSSIEFIFFIDVVTAIMAILVLLIALKVPPHARAELNEEFSYFTDLKEGFRYVQEHKFLKVYFIFAGLFMFMATPVSFLTPLQVTRNFGDDVWRLTAIELAFSVGMTLGGVLMAVWGGFKNRVVTMGFSSVLMGIMTISLGFTNVFWIYLGLMGLFGLAMPIFNTPGTVMVQERVEPEYLGRVFSIMGMIASLSLPLGMGIFGPLADVTKIEYLLMATGLVLTYLGFRFFTNKVIVEAGKPKLQVAVETNVESDDTTPIPLKELVQES